MADPTPGVLGQLGLLDRFLPLWIGLAMAAGLALGSLFPGLNDGLDDLRIGTVSVPIAIGLLLMMYPVLAKVRYEQLGKLRRDRRFFVAALALSWLVAPLFMFGLAWSFLADQPEYRTGVIIVGLAPCIAMVLVWNELARGDNDRAAVLVVLNALIQMVAYSLLGYFYLTVLPGWLGLDTQGFDVGIWEVARTVLVFLGIPLLAGYLTRRIAVRRKGRDWYDRVFMPRIAPITPYALLCTIVLLFAIQGETITDEPLDVVRIAIPLLVYFTGMWITGVAYGRLQHLTYPRTTTLAFTVASNNFELAIAVAVGVFGASSGQALAGVVGPLIEVPVLVALVYVALWLRRKLGWPALGGLASDRRSWRRDGALACWKPQPQRGLDASLMSFVDARGRSECGPPAHDLDHLVEDRPGRAALEAGDAAAVLEVRDGEVVALSVHRHLVPACPLSARAVGVRHIECGGEAPGACTTHQECDVLDVVVLVPSQRC